MTPPDCDRPLIERVGEPYGPRCWCRICVMLGHVPAEPPTLYPPPAPPAADPRPSPPRSLFDTNQECEP